MASTWRRIGLVSTLATGLAASGAGLSAANPPFENPPCMARNDVHAQLDRKYAEVPVAVGLADNGAVLEIFTAKDGATWTVVMSLPNGMTCLIAAGEAFQTLPLRIAGSGA
jgi:hypothetical protein